MSNPLDFKLSYRRNLPHIQPPGATLFVTFRLAGSLPKVVLERWRQEAQARERVLAALPEVERTEKRYVEEKRFFGRYDAELDRADYGPTWLRDARVAKIVYEAIRCRDGVLYDLEVFTIMPNHVHAVFTPRSKDDEQYYALSFIMHGLKRESAWNANTALSRKGAFWQSESHDHYVRNPDELQRIIHYVLNNPVKAGLAAAWDEWPWTYGKHAPQPVARVP